MSFPYGTNAKPLVVFITFFVDLKQVVNLLFTGISLRIIHLLSQTIFPKNLIPFPHINHWQNLEDPSLMSESIYPLPLPPSPSTLSSDFKSDIAQVRLWDGLSQLVRKSAMHTSIVFVNEGLSFVGGSFHGNTCDSYYFDWLYTSVNYDLYLCALFSCYSITQTQSFLFYLSC